MTRADLLKLIARYKERAPERLSVVTRLESFVQNDALCAERSNMHGHLTGSAWVVNPSRTRVLLLHHRKLSRWIQLGGHADGDFDLCGVALREAREESGLSDITPVSPEIFDIDIHEIPAWKDVPAHLHYDVRFLFEADDQKLPTANEESHDVAWIALGDLRSYSDEESVLRMSRLTSTFVNASLFTDSTSQG